MILPNMRQQQLAKALVIAACWLSLAGLISACQETRQSLALKFSPESSVKFRFENYKSPEVAKNELLSLFPLNTQATELMTLMRKLEARCYTPAPDEDKPTFCYYREKPLVPVVVELWIVSFKTDSENRLIHLDVTSDVISL